MIEALTDIRTAAAAVSAILSIVGIVAGFNKIRRLIVYRNLRKVLGISDGDRVVVVCSELDEAEKRQMVEDREYIYLMKYGDLDAWVELIFSLLRIYPNIDLRIMASGEAMSSTIDLQHQILLIGGPDYNLLTRRLHDMGATRMGYAEEVTQAGNSEIALVDKVTSKRFYHTTLEKDFGYIERIVNPFDQERQILFFGGCHTVGVTAATKFFSAFSGGRAVTAKQALENARVVARELKGREQPFSLLVQGNKVGSSIAAPSYLEATLYRGSEQTAVNLARHANGRWRTFLRWIGWAK